ncbi:MULTISPECIES: hypothetical protein [Ponticaulis]|jgi:positive regulator of sigma E activity|uniref:hypothetical protein n=1 Tax=Ponticaulis TaxID=1123044 RepID=UPI0003B71A7F|nr:MULTISPECIES: hypothetical protein [Ponticaulis]MAF58660.1 hypothetical protein [Ponticaulis sp.]MBN06020.1 hypothetical protein [Ponticaulis sp.]MDF1680953.1 hypothetical protein [Ponticaulis sp.]|tara:strand:- start:199 stop:384 length:186 start_codon:yes stop_codon:yes gene_type:complete
MSSFTIYVVGFIILIAGLAYGAAMLGVPAQWIAVVAIAMSGLGLISAVTHTRKKDETEASQ